MSVVELYTDEKRTPGDNARLREMFDQMDRLAGEHGATARVLCRNGRTLGLRCGPATEGWPAEAPFTHFDVWAPDELHRPLFTRHATPNPFIYTTVPRLLICDQIAAYGGPLSVLVRQSPHRARVSVEVEADAGQRRDVLTALVEAVQGIGNAVIKKSESILQ